MKSNGRFLAMVGPDRAFNGRLFWIHQELSADAQEPRKQARGRVVCRGGGGGSAAVMKKAHNSWIGGQSLGYKG